ncbi:phospholipase A1-like [Atheta coriaria]|uniref:phospholipase A1-like n=1 Tax=Dalotia coriaria TaxID=877792 RepID=UPI0031F3635D
MTHPNRQFAVNASSATVANDFSTHNDAMKNKSLIYLAIHVILLGMVTCQIMSFLANPAALIKEELLLHNASLANRTMRDCTWRPVDMKTVCPDEDIKTILYTPDGQKEVVDPMQDDWLRQSAYDSDKEDILLIHGYAGGDDTLPIAVLRDAYIKNGSYNVWMLDWGALCQPPCYPAAVHNIKAVAKCTGDLLMALRRVGLRTDKLTCVGHSLGAHTCGLIAKHVQFRMHRIVALDPARPLLPAASRLSSGDASAVHAVHTNAGHYGEAGRSGHVDFCINGGRTQPYCENAGFDVNLCSHVWAICYMAESLHPSLARRAEPCSRRCPTGPRPGHRIGIPILLGQFTPLKVSGSYCVFTPDPPYCPQKPGDIGDVRCCLRAPDYEVTEVIDDVYDNITVANYIIS